MLVIENREIHGMTEGTVALDLEVAVWELCWTTSSEVALRWIPQSCPLLHKGVGTLLAGD